MTIFANLKYFGKEQASNLDVERVHQRHVKRFTSINLTIVAHAFDFMANLNINCLMSREDVNRTSGTHTSLPTSFLGLQNATLITSKCLLKFSFASNYSQYCGYTTPKLSMTSWIGNLPCNSITRLSTTLTTQITTTSMQIRLPPFQIPNKQNVKKFKVRVKFKLSHSTSTRMMVVAYTSLVTCETTLVYKSRWVAQMCC